MVFKNWKVPYFLRDLCDMKYQNHWIHPRHNSTSHHAYRFWGSLLESSMRASVTDLIRHFVWHYFRPFPIGGCPPCCQLILFLWRGYSFQKVFKPPKFSYKSEVDSFWMGVYTLLLARLVVRWIDLVSLRHDSFLLCLIKTNFPRERPRAKNQCGRNRPLMAIKFHEIDT